MKTKRFILSLLLLLPVLFGLVGCTHKADYSDNAFVTENGTMYRWIWFDDLEDSDYTEFFFKPDGTGTYHVSGEEVKKTTYTIDSENNVHIRIEGELPQNGQFVYVEHGKCLMLNNGTPFEEYTSPEK